METLCGQKKPPQLSAELALRKEPRFTVQSWSFLGNADVGSRLACLLTGPLDTQALTYVESLKRREGTCTSRFPSTSRE